jgi:hypothetical protein
LDVLHADWQDVRHSPQPPRFAERRRLRVTTVFILRIGNTPFLYYLSDDTTAIASCQSNMKNSA